MISALNGIIKGTSPQHILIEVGPIECTLQVPDSTPYQNGSNALIHIYMHWNAENGPSFYGFATPLDRTVFTLIISCSGIGPKIGLSALASLRSTDILEAIQLGDVRTLSSINGIGTKKAEQIILHLKHKISTLIATSDMLSGSPKIEQWNTIQLALESLSYSRHEISLAMDQLKTASSQQEYSFDQLLRKALTFLSK